MALVQLTQRPSKKRIGVNPALVAAVLEEDDGCTICTIGMRHNAAGLNVKVVESYEEVFARISMRNAMEPKSIASEAA